MTLLRKFIGLFLFVLLLLVVSLLCFGYYSLHRIASEKPGVLAVSGLDQPVDIRRDPWGIPHIYSQTDHDLFFAIGFAQAQDRLFQMDLFRRAACGTLSEIFGERTAPLDEWSRTMGLAPLSDRLLAALPMESRRLLEAYSAGVNAWLLSDPPQPLECALLQYRVQPWQPRESLAVLRLFGWLLSMGWHVDSVLGEIAEKVGGEKIQRLTGGISATVDPAAAQALAGLAPLFHEILGFVPNGVGSNGWAVSGFRSSSSAPLLANDTHLPFITPSVYYLLHLSSPGYQAVGASFPGLPGIVVGRNRHIAWGVTHGMIDDFDFYRLAADSLDPGKFIYNGQALPYTFREERVAVKGATEKRVRIRSTPWGPVMPATAFAQRPLAMQWSGFALSDEWTAFLKMMTATNWYEFRNALSTCKTPGEHFIYADLSGHIGSQLAAAVPQRSFAGSFAPASDSLAQRRWLSDVPFTSLPSQADPVSGYVVQANQQLGHSRDPFPLTGYWEPHYRYQRIVDRLDSLPRLSLNDMKTLQNDLYNGHAAWFVPQVIASLSGFSAQADSPEHLAKELLHGWDYQQTQESIAALIYEMTYLQVFRNTLADELGEDLFDRFLALPHVNVALMDGLIARGDSSWFDNVYTPEKETCRDVLAKSFFSAVDSLKKQRGDNLGDWSWGAVHTLSGFHPFALHPVIGRFFAFPEIPAAGGNFTLCNATYIYQQPFKTFVGPCIRQLVDLSTQEYHVILYGGQSGHPFSRHYQDQKTLWRQGKLITLTLDPSAENRSAWTVFRLLPK